jgi:hypothetical protein
MLPTCMLSFLPESSPIHLHHLSPYHHIHLLDSLPRPMTPVLVSRPSGPFQKKVKNPTNPS